MNELTSEQLKKIQENKKAAELKRQQGSSLIQPVGRHIQNILVPNCIVPKNVRNAAPSSTVNQGKTMKIAPAVFQLISDERFIVEMCYHEAAINIMKSMKDRVFDYSSKKWTFPLTEHDYLVTKLATIRNVVDVSPLPRNVLNAFRQPLAQLDVDLGGIDEKLVKSLLPFQLEGVKFGISRRGRCLLADDMGLGKTIQALGIAHYFVDKWPLLIVCPSSMRFPWEEAIHNFLPSVNPFHVMVMTTGNDVIHDAKVVIVSYDLLTSCLDGMKLKKFGVIIFDESHFLKAMKSGRTRAALELTPRAQHVILLSGTPALSRPFELYPQIHAIDPSCFKTLHDFGIRYCDGRKRRYGWDYSGSSNNLELELLLKRKFMLRRLKSEVMSQMPSKLRKVVVLQPRLVHAVSKQMNDFATQMERQRGLERRGTLFQFYCATGAAKLPAIREYLGDKLERPGKMLIFAHHSHVLDGLCELLMDKNVDYIRIDGATSAECRAQNCERFQTDPSTRVAVLSLKAANSGITLTAAQLVIFAELYWNPGELTQAEDRAHRIGQRDSVIVEYLIAKGTADDHLWSLVQSKLCVLNSVGLSKDSFKNANTEHLHDKEQLTLPDMFANIADARKEDIIPNLDSADFEDDFEDDIIFDSLDLDNLIDDKSQNKRMKMDV